MICIRPDAVKKTDGLSAVAQDVITTVVRDDEFWPAIDQLTYQDCQTLGGHDSELQEPRGITRNMYA